MKKTLTLMLMLAVCATMSAQKPSREDFEKAHKERIEKRAKAQAKELKLDKGTSVWFTNLYIEYEEQLSAVRKEAMKDMPRPPRPSGDKAEEEQPEFKEKEMKKLTDEEAEKLILGRFDVAEKELQVKRDYYNRFREKLTPKQLMGVFAQPRGGMRGMQGRNMGGQHPHGGPGNFPPMGGPGGFPPMGHGGM